MNGRGFWTHCIPPGSRSVPPTKSQKNLRQIKPQKPAQKVSANYGQARYSKEDQALTNTRSDSNKARVLVPNQVSHFCEMSEVSVEEPESAIGMNDEERCSKRGGLQQPAEEKKEGKMEVKNERVKWNVAAHCRR